MQSDRPNNIQSSHDEPPPDADGQADTSPDRATEPRASVKSGFVAVIGRPSSGKSTLINAVCGGKVSITSSVPQTTRNVIRGIYTTPDQDGQIVFLDTPGFHNSERRFNEHMKTVAMQGMNGVDVILYTLDTTRAPGEEELAIRSLILRAELPTVVALTKTDAATSDGARARDFLRQADTNWPVVTVGGLNRPTEQAEELPQDEIETPTRTGLTNLLGRLFDLLPSGELFYPPEFYTDQEPRFRIAEIIREQAIRQARQEVPHALYVEVADLQAKNVDPATGQPGSLWARTFIYVERETQKGILVGKKGRVVTAIRTEAERIVRDIFPYPVSISLQVKVRPKWRKNENLLNRIVY